MRTRRVRLCALSARAFCFSNGAESGSQAAVLHFVPAAVASLMHAWRVFAVVAWQVRKHLENGGGGRDEAYALLVKNSGKVSASARSLARNGGSCAVVAEVRPTAAKDLGLSLLKLSLSLSLSLSCCSSCCYVMVCVIAADGNHGMVW